MEMTISELTEQLIRAEEEMRVAVAGIVSSIRVPQGVNLSIYVDLIDCTGCGDEVKKYLVGRIKITPQFGM